MFQTYLSALGVEKDHVVNRPICMRLRDIAVRRCRFQMISFMKLLCAEDLVENCFRIVS